MKIVMNVNERNMLYNAYPQRTLNLKKVTPVV